MNTEINDRVKTLRLSMQKSQIEFCELLDIKQASLSDVERKKINVSPKLIEKIVEKLGVSSDWLYTGNGKIFIASNDNEIYGINVQDDVRVNEKTTTFSDKSGLNDKTKKILLEIEANEINKAMVYYNHPDTKLNSIYAKCLGDLLKNFNDYLKLIKVSNSFGAPEFIQEKFKSGINFKEYKKNLDQDILEIHNELNDERLIRCIKIVHYEEGIEYYQSAISQLINYMEMYADFYKGFQKPGVFKVE